jgi:internalin A
VQFNLAEAERRIEEVRRTQAEILDLSDTEVTDLSSLSSLQGLQTLNLYGCRPAVPAELLRVFADHPHLTELRAHEAVGVPREVLSHNEYDNCLPRLRTHLSELGLAVLSGPTGREIPAQG